LASELAKDVDIKDAVKWAASAWNEVNPVTIKNCFKEAGFSTELDEVEEEPEDVDLSDLELDIDLNSYINFDNDLETCEQISDGWEENMVHRIKDR
jgi:hypothetical protein